MAFAPWSDAKAGGTLYQTRIFQIRTDRCALLATERLRNVGRVLGKRYISFIFFTLTKIFFEITLAQTDMYM